MSTASVDISYDLIDGIYDVLYGNVIYELETIPVYKSVPKTPASVYILIGDVLGSEDGTKDGFLYFGTVQVIVVDESAHCADRKQSQGILGVVRGLLKATKPVTFTCGSRTLVVFSHESLVPVIEYADNSIIRNRLIDIYNYVLE